MEEWKEYRIGDVCDTISDTYRGNAENVILINTSDVLEGKCLNHIKVPNKDLKGQFKKTFRKDDILYSEIRPANKRYAYIDFDATDYIASTKLMVIRHNERILPQYLFYILKSQAVLDELQMLAESRSGTFPQITFSEVANMEIKLPPIEQQRRILGVLKSLDDKIEVNRRINENLEQQAQALFKSWFVDFEPFKDQPFVESELGMIPQGWRVQGLGEVSRMNAGGDKPIVISDVPTELCKVPIYSNGLDNDGLYGFTNEARIIEPAVTISARGTIGDVNLRLTPYCPIVRLISIIPNPSIHVYYLYYALKNKRIEGVGTTQQQLTVPNFKREKIIIPTSGVIDSFKIILEPIIKKKRVNKIESRRLAELRDTLLPRLMSGELKVNDVI